MVHGRVLNLKPNLTEQAQVSQTGAGVWHLELPAGREGRYRLAQLDDYSNLRREIFPWNPSVSLSLGAKASHRDIPGTWGFGLWNDPFSLSFGFGGGTRRWPVLPQAAWFFFASAPNYLSLRDDLPAQGSLVATFCSPQWPTYLMALGAPALPLLLWSPSARLIRRLGRRFVRQDAVTMGIDPTEWHSYVLQWYKDFVCFQVDGRVMLETPVSPPGPLGLVIWIDNQYAALPPSGRLSYGTLANPEPAWIDIKALSVSA
jgi:hypothetical protein